jgi:hypothetical protein
MNFPTDNAAEARIFYSTLGNTVELHRCFSQRNKTGAARTKGLLGVDCNRTNLWPIKAKKREIHDEALTAALTADGVVTIDAGGLTRCSGGASMRLIRSLAE